MRVFTQLLPKLLRVILRNPTHDALCLVEGIRMRSHHVWALALCHELLDAPINLEARSKWQLFHDVPHLERHRKTRLEQHESGKQASG